MRYTFSPGIKPCKRMNKFGVRVTKWDDGGFVDYTTTNSDSTYRLPTGDFLLLFKKEPLRIKFNQY